MSIFQSRAARARSAAQSMPDCRCPTVRNITRSLAVTLAALTLTGCAGYLTAIPKYDVRSELGEVTDEHGDWVIRDRAFENVLMIRPSLDRVFGNSFVDGATLWTTDINASNFYQQAVIAWFYQEGRTCHTMNGRRIGPTQFEFRYVCDS